MSDDPYANVFDFSGLKSYAPAALRVIDANKNYMSLERKTAARTMIFYVFKENGEFKLHARNREYGEISRATCDESNFVMRADNIGKILAALGYSKARVRQVSTQLNLSRPQA